MGPAAAPRRSLFLNHPPAPVPSCHGANSRHAACSLPPPRPAVTCCDPPGTTQAGPGRCVGGRQPRQRVSDPPGAPRGPELPPIASWTAQHSTAPSRPAPGFSLRAPPITSWTAQHRTAPTPARRHNTNTTCVQSAPSSPPSPPHHADPFSCVRTSPRDAVSRCSMLCPCIAMPCHAAACRHTHPTCNTYVSTIVSSVSVVVTIR